MHGDDGRVNHSAEDRIGFLEAPGGNKIISVVYYTIIPDDPNKPQQQQNQQSAPDLISASG